MEGNYEVLFGNRSCGKVQVLRQGLYSRFLFRCSLSGNVLCRLQVNCGGKQEDLGVLIPGDSGFGLDKKVPVKHFGEGIPQFRLHTKQTDGEERFIPIIPEEPFAYMARLKGSYLVRRNGQTGILL